MARDGLLPLQQQCEGPRCGTRLSPLLEARRSQQARIMPQGSLDALEGWLLKLEGEAELEQLASVAEALISANPGPEGLRRWTRGPWGACDAQRRPVQVHGVMRNPRCAFPWTRYSAGLSVRSTWLAAPPRCARPSVDTSLLQRSSTR